ncbi:glycosyltransferase 87 family protein [Streptomyces sp. NRRL F-5630]|uniref:glycosyltransferase 87 family protein n=1 Tax=Streptomyces sp. NRRL F-5630 TaxID=1463864 RepID=UPI0004CAEC8D|nr:glycosyltransferase 87 family protein [Streptomyces sp. NRRL F-5630]
MTLRQLRGSRTCAGVPGRVWCAVLLLCGGYALGLCAVSTQGPHRVWGGCAGGGYALAAWCAARGRGRWAVRCAVGGALVVPGVYLLARGAGQSEVFVLERAAHHLVSTGTPYESEPVSVRGYTPYLPGAALLGLPSLVFPGPWGDARLWCAVVFLGCLWGARPVSGAPRYGRGLAVLCAAPPFALACVVSGVDLPVAGVCVLGLALAGRGRAGRAGVVLGLGCAVKWTVCPALAVAGALLVGRARPRSGARALAALALGACGPLAVLVLPWALASPGVLVEQVFAFPSGHGRLATPAASPLPGQLLAGLGPGGWWCALVLLLLAASGMGWWLLRRPPGTAGAAAVRLAVGLSSAFALAPASRFGYFLVPFVLAGWARLVAGGAAQSGTGRDGADVSPGGKGLAGPTGHRKGTTTA